LKLQLSRNLDAFSAKIKARYIKKLEKLHTMKVTRVPLKNQPSCAKNSFCNSLLQSAIIKPA
jgi:hypothetical protein